MERRKTERRERWWTDDAHTVFVRCAGIREIGVDAEMRRRLAARMHPMTLEEFCKYRPGMD